MLIVGYYGFQNNGDDAMLLGLLDELAEDITVIHGDALSINLKGVRSVEWTLLNLVKETIRTDKVIIGGGTMLRDWGQGKLLQSLKVLAYAFAVRLLGKKLYLINIGHDSSKNPYKLLHTAVFKLANRVSFRDDYFDLSALIKDIPQAKESKTLAVMLTPNWSIYYAQPDKDGTVECGVAEAVTEWLKGDPERKVKCISLNGHPRHSDNWINKELSVLIGDRAEFVPYSPNPMDTLNHLSECCGAIGMRYHACVFSFLVGIPLIYIRTKPYCDKFYSQISHWLPIETWDIDTVKSRVKDYLSLMGLFKYKLSFAEAKDRARKGIMI